MSQTRSAKELIDLLNQLGESRNIEAKRGSDTGRSIHETISAFSNEPGLGGGYIVLGVEKEQAALFPAYTATGIKDIEKLKRDITTQCNADTFNITIRPKLLEETVNGQPVLVVYMPLLRLGTRSLPSPCAPKHLSWMIFPRHFTCPKDQCSERTDRRFQPASSARR